MNNLEQQAITKSLIIPVYNSEENIPHLLPVLKKMAASQGSGFEVIFVIDGSPDNSKELLNKAITELDFPCRIVSHSKNFGSFMAIRTGMEYAQGKYIAAMAADLQEPPELIEQFFEVLEKDAADVIFGQRVGRDDPFFKKLFSNCYWAVYKKIAQPDIPTGGVDVFACNRVVRDSILAIEESNASLVAQLFWVGFRRHFVPYQRQQREHGKSAWSFKRRLKYMFDSIFSYSDFPIIAILMVGMICLLITMILGSVTIIGKLFGFIDTPGYTMTILVELFFGSAILTTQGFIGCYLWRAVENSKKRPLKLISEIEMNQTFKSRMRNEN